jgi:CRISPR/Cas system-associated exonuclease Cas4 (RecB family)
MDFIKDAGIFRYVLKECGDGREILRIRQLRALGSFVNMVKASDLAKPALRLDEFMAELKTRNDHGLGIKGSLVTLTQAGVRVYTAHGSKGLEFHSVIIPFCLQNKNWPARQISDKIQLPYDLFKTKERVKDKDALKQLVLQDETRLFYVAMTRARSNLIFTASPAEDSVSSSYLNKLDIKKEAQGFVDEKALIEKSLEMTDLKDPFIGTEEVLKDMISNLTMNPTRLNNYITCPRRFLYNDILKLPGVKKKSLVFGNCVHKALEDTYGIFKETGKFPLFAFFQEAFRKELKFQGVDKVMARDCLEKMKTLKDWFDAAAKAPVMPIGLEQKLVVTVGDNIIFTGKYDKVEWADEKKGLVRIVDYKTGKPDEHLKKIDEAGDLASPDCDGYLRQVVCYKLLFESDRKAAKGRKASHGTLVFIEPVSGDLRRQGYKKGDYANKNIAITDAMVANVKDVITDTWKNICALKFAQLEKRDERICGNCDFDKICWL